MTSKFKMRRESYSLSDQRAAQIISEECDIPLFAARILVARGIDDPSVAEQFLHPSLERDWLNPYDIRDMDPLINRLERAINEREHIVVFSDFDLDGISATSVMARAIRALGGRVTPFIPHRFDEGYGISDAAIERLVKLDPDVVITVDCGISARDEVEKLQSMGIDVLITDHHEAGQSVPVGVPVVNPKAEEDNPSAILAGVGVSLKVAAALGSRFGYPHLWRSYTDLAALGTVADMMPMIEENRALVADGLKLMNENPRPSISALMAVSDMGDKELTSSNLSFSLVPRLNAAGRMGNAELALDLLMSDSFEEASLYASKLNEVNDKRRQIEAELTVLAQEAAEEKFVGQRVLVVAGKGWHEGVKGIVASRLTNIYKVPVILFTIDENGEAHGSGRSVGNVNLFEAVDSLSDILIRYGGHEAAVGVTLTEDKLDEFAMRLNEYMLKIPQSEFTTSVLADTKVEMSELDIESVKSMRKLAPFGLENPEPILLAKDVVLDQCRAVGADKNHLSCKLTDGRSAVSGIMFRCDDIDRLMSNDAVADALFTVDIDQWRGRSNVKAMIKAIEPPDHDQCDALSASEKDFLEQLLDAGGSCSCSDPLDDDVCPIIGSFKDESACTDELRNRIISSLIGDEKPHEAQQSMLDKLEKGASVLGVMATGRGKSLVFQVHAAMMALMEHKASLFVYPLRALMADQAFHITEKFREFGIDCRVLSGETNSLDREETYKGLADGSVDIIITTPEFLAYNADRIAESNRVGFMVVDEAHHIGQAKAGNRSAYANLGNVVSCLGDPVVLAVTATANSDVANSIESSLPVVDKVVDLSSRDNLHIDDQRGIKQKDEYIAHIVANGDKAIIYVNSREMSVALARKLRTLLPQIAEQIGFYNAGLSREERTRIEGLFRSGGIKVLCATSAFGEGVDIPDVRHVFLYHMPFSDIEFNQMSGRAGRDGNDSWVHLLFGAKDANINNDILENLTPNRNVLAQVYRTLKGLQKESPDINIQVSANELAKLACTTNVRVTDQTALCGISVFSELGLIDAERRFGDEGEYYSIKVIEGADKVELTDSVRYCEGLDEREDFLGFKEWAMLSSIDELTDRITHPIAPE